MPADVCVITPIGMDHSQWLGETLEEIAMEKAGILLEGVPVIVAKQKEEVLRVLLEEANVQRCPLTVIDEPLVGYSVGIPGKHQRFNANVAVHAVHEVGIHLTYDTVKECLEHVYWPGRFEQVRGGDFPMVIDGAHNLQAAEALVETWQAEYPGLEPTIVFGAVEGKDIVGVLKELKKLSGSFILTLIDSPRTLALDVLVEALGEVEELRKCRNLQDVFELKDLEKRPVLVAGSLFLVGQVKAMIEKGVFESSWQ